MYPFTHPSEPTPLSPTTSLSPYNPTCQQTPSTPTSPTGTSPQLVRTNIPISENLIVSHGVNITFRGCC